MSELCTVEPRELGFTEADFAVSQEMAGFFSSLMPQNADRLFNIGTAADQEFSGVPVRRISLTGQRTVSEIVEVSRQAFDDALFAVPASFERQAMSSGR